MIWQRTFSFCRGKQSHDAQKAEGVCNLQLQSGPQLRPIRTIKYCKSLVQPKREAKNDAKKQAISRTLLLLGSMCWYIALKVVQVCGIYQTN